MRILLCLTLVLLSASHYLEADHSTFIAVKDPAVAPDLQSFYRSIRALIGDSALNGTAVAIV